MSRRDRTYSAVEKYRRRLARAEAHLYLCQVRHSALQFRWSTAAPAEREELERRGWLARLELNDAADAAAAARRQLAEEEKRLLQPDSFLRFV